MSSKKLKQRDALILNRRAFVSSLTSLGVGFGLGSTGLFAAPSLPPIPVSAINHMTIAVSNPTASLEWYQRLFGMPIAAR